MSAHFLRNLLVLAGAYWVAEWLASVIMTGEAALGKDARAPEPPQLVGAGAVQAQQDDPARGRLRRSGGAGTGAEQDEEDRKEEASHGRTSYAVPVEPKPPSPRALSPRVSTSSTCFR